MITYWSVDDYVTVTQIRVMSDGFFIRLENRVQSSNTLLCIGLDPHSSEVGICISYNYPLLISIITELLSFSWQPILLKQPTISASTLLRARINTQLHSSPTRLSLNALVRKGSMFCRELSRASQLTSLSCWTAKEVTSIRRHRWDSKSSDYDLD